jgi:hypothetical protein
MARSTGFNILHVINRMIVAVQRSSASVKRSDFQIRTSSLETV